MKNNIIFLTFVLLAFGFTQINNRPTYKKQQSYIGNDLGKIQKFINDWSKLHYKFVAMVAQPETASSSGGYSTYSKANILVIVEEE